MTGPGVATAQWRALDREGEDKCRLSHAGDGWLLVGHARFRDAAGFAALDYVLRCDEGWRTLSADIAGTHDDFEVQLRVVRDGARWWLNDVPQDEVEGAVDLDLSFTPATNLMPLRRLLVTDQSSQDVAAAWLPYPETVLRRLDQIYERTGLPDVISYSARQTDFATRLSFDRSGFVTFYPDHWEGEIRYED